jgi:dipeptidyl aminopeptidase/acylaminoacyl peptidase
MEEFCLRIFTRAAMIISFISVLLMGCDATTDQFEDKQSTQILNYFISDQKAKINSTEDQLLWKMGGVTFTAKKSVTTITSMQVSNDAGQYEISVPEEIQHNKAELTSISVSPSNKYIAINIFITNVGNQLIVVNLSNGESNTIHDLTNTSYETIHTYSWSPLGEKLAFAYGDPSSSKLAIYDFDTQGMKSLSVNKLINTIYILWDKHGNRFDFISESPSDQFKIYRYTVSTDEVEEISTVSVDDLSKYIPFGPN